MNSNYTARRMKMEIRVYQLDDTGSYKLFGLGRQFRQITFWVFGVFSSDLSVPLLVQWVPLSMFSINQPLFLQKNVTLSPKPKYLFGNGIRIWASNN